MFLHRLYVMKNGRFLAVADYDDYFTQKITWPLYFFALVFTAVIIVEGL